MTQAVFVYRAAFAAAVFTLCACAALGWTTVGDGIEYAEFTTPDPNRLFVTRMLRANASATIESSIANGTIKGARETVRNQAARLDDAINWWGQTWGARNRVVAAINGDFFNATTGVISGGQCQSGWYAKRFPNFGGYSGFIWNVNRGALFGNCVNHEATKQIITYPQQGSYQQQFHGINVARADNQLIVYTPQYDTRTPSATTGAEVLVEVARPNVIILYPNKVVGHVRAIWQNSGSHWIPFDHVVLSAHGTAAATLLSKISVGSEIWISQFPTDYNEPDTSGQGGCNSPTGLDWQKAYASVGVNYRFLENGAVRPPDPSYPGYAGLVVRNPRTAVAYNSSYVFFVVCDGRSAQSVGMTMTELGNWCLNTLGATDAANLDGGGSSTMVVNGAVKNVPSDGSERTVANGLMMVNVLPKEQSTFFSAGQPVVTTGSANCRLGPGTNYGAITTVANNTAGTIVDHPLDGVRAKGYYWWKVDFSGTVGWVAETLLAAVNAPPAITQHPQPASVCPGSPAYFTVGASGSGTLSYRWQKNQVNLNNQGHYSGVTTPTLTVSECDTSDAAGYGCVVTNAYGSAVSNEAALTLKSAPGITIGSPSSWVTSAGPVTFTVSYTNASLVSLDIGHVILHKTGTADASVSVQGSGTEERSITLSSISGDGAMGVSIAPGTATSPDGCPAPAAGPSATFLVDNTPPSAVTVTDEGTLTPSLTALAAEWTEASDGSGSGVERYEYAIGTAPNLQDIRGWTSTGFETSMSDSELALTEGQTYYIQARAADNAGNHGLGSSADGITAAEGAESIGHARSLIDNLGLSLRGKVVTASFPGAFWIEEIDRTAAIKVVSNAGPAGGNTVSVAGVLGTSGEQRALFGDVVVNHGGFTDIAPLGMRVRNLGGAAANALTPGVSGSVSLHNVGLLVRCWGMVTYSDSTDPTDRFFYIDDGSAPPDWGPHPGVRVRCGSFAPPPGGSAVVTGVVAIERFADRLVPALLIRDARDIVTHP